MQDGPFSRRKLRSRQKRLGKAVIAGLWLPLVASSCESYEASPLDLQAHRVAWEGRDLEEASLRAFIERLQFERGPAAVDDAQLEFEPTDGVDLTEGRMLALVFNPGLRLARLKVERIAGSKEFAGLLSDPRLGMNALRIARDVPDPWILTPGLEFRVPLSNRLEVEKDLAASKLSVARRDLLEAEWKLWRDVEIAWGTWSAARLRHEETQKLVEILDEFVTQTRALAESGNMSRTESTLFEIDQAQLMNQAERASLDASMRELDLRALLGLAPEAPLDLIPHLGAFANEGILEMTESEARTRLVDGHPELLHLREQYRVAEETLRLAIAKQYPDLNIGPLLEIEQGRTAWGLIGGLVLPIFDGNAWAIADARGARELARARYEVAFEDLAGRLTVARSRTRGLADQREDIEGRLVPLVDHHLESSLRLLQLGEAMSSVLLESLERNQQTKLTWINVQADLARARAELTYLLGPTDHETAEERESR